MKCTACGFRNIDEVKFCGNCGIRLMQTPTSVVHAPATGPSKSSLHKKTRAKGPQQGNSRTDGHDADESIDLAVSASQYKIIDSIGSGGMGTVYLARDDSLDRYVALKRLGKTFVDNPWMKERLFREAKSIAALSHVNIVQVYALGEDDQGPFIVMEHVSGPGKTSAGDRPSRPLDLGEKIANDGVLSGQAALGLMKKLCSAVKSAHNRGIIHRDLKPSNVLLNEFHEPKIVDFGLARREHGEDIRLTGTGTRIVSLGFGAPEQETDASTADARADIYALGAVFYFCLTGENPRFFRESKVPAYLLSLVLKAMAKDREERWQTVMEFERALTAAESSSAFYKSPTIEKGMWRCKWCNTTNPFINRYCSECGWVGVSKCPECDAEMRVGVRFCGTCGSDIKAFEEAGQLLNRLQEYFDGKDYAHVLEQGTSIKGFQARRNAGWAILHAVSDLQERAKRALNRKEELRESIPKAVEHRNYERALELVQEYETLDSSDVFAELKAELPSKITEWKIADNMKKAGEALNHRDWTGAERFCRDILDNFKRDHAEAKRLLRRVEWSRRLARTGELAIIFLCCFVLYVLSVCPSLALARKFKAASAAARIARTSCTPVLWLYKNTVLKGPLEKYAELWGVDLNVTANPSSSGQ